MHVTVTWDGGSSTVDGILPYRVITTLTNELTVVKAQMPKKVPPLQEEAF